MTLAVQKINRGISVAAIIFQLFWVSFANSADNVSNYQPLLSQIKETLKSAPNTFAERVRKEGLNAPIPELSQLMDNLQNYLLHDKDIQGKVKQNRAFEALYVQTLNHVKHVRMNFEMGNANYTHDFVLKGPLPFRPTLITLQKVKELFEIANSEAQPIFDSKKDPVREKQLIDEQQNLVKKITAESYSSYKDMRERLSTQGLNASFPEFRAVVEYLQLKLQTDEVILNSCKSNKYLSNFRSLVLSQLESLIRPSVNGTHLPYLRTVDVIERATEFLDVLQRNNDPSRSPKLYHSGRYEYYLHFLKAEAPNHISFPTLVSLGATDIMKARGVPIGFWGVNTDVVWVDGYYQTSYEFLIHDVNHTRRMYQFQKEEAQRLGLSLDEFTRRSDEFVKSKLIPLISIKKADDEVTKNKKRLIKILLFEILHEDALPASKEVIETAVLRPANKLTPFERIDNDSKVVYVMEPGATTLAYVFRKLAHDFYDKPDERQKNIVNQEFRTRENIIEAAETLFKDLGLEVRRDLFEHFVVTDEGFPKDYRSTLVRDIKKRPSETLPLNEIFSNGLKCSNVFKR